MPSCSLFAPRSRRPNIQIVLDNDQAVYTTGDTISGTVFIASHRDSHFHSITIDFVGQSRTSLQRPSATSNDAGRADSCYQFMRYSQHYLERYYPTDKVLKADKKYEFRFRFLVPEQVHAQGCTHPVRHQSVRDAHRQLPPTLEPQYGSTLNASTFSKGVDIASIRYAVWVGVWKLKGTSRSTGEASLRAWKQHLVNIVPGMASSPTQAEGRDAYQLHCVKKVLRTSVWGKKAGVLSLHTRQQSCFRLPRRGSAEISHPHVVTASLRFDPISNDCVPPRLDRLVTTLNMTTWAASSPCEIFPARADAVVNGWLQYAEGNTCVSKLCLTNEGWVKHYAIRPTSPDSRIPTGSDLPAGVQPPQKELGAPYYTATMQVPVVLPANDTFVPTFHSCLVSRVYHLQLDLQVLRRCLWPYWSIKIKLPINIRAAFEYGLSRVGQNLAGYVSPPDYYEAALSGIAVHQDDRFDVGWQALPEYERVASSPL